MDRLGNQVCFYLYSAKIQNKIYLTLDMLSRSRITFFYFLLFVQNTIHCTFQPHPTAPTQVHITAQCSIVNNMRHDLKRGGSQLYN